MDSTADNPSGRRLAALSLAALGIVFGDIGTSPLYALRECFHGEYGIAVTPANVLGVLSLIFWALLLIVTIKYLLFILRADSHGEGGVLVLTSLVKAGGADRSAVGRTLVALGLFAACLLYGDGMITPAISVLSAVEGLGHIEPAFQPHIISVTLAILTGLFLIQKHGTARVGTLFGPVILVWMIALAGLGLSQILRTPQVIKAFSPWYGLAFLLDNRLHGFVVLGAVFLVATGAEAVYADMGHFGRRPIRLTWFGLVLPCLVLNYFGQGAHLLNHPADAYHPFYAIVPSWALIPMVALATMATIIASQAVITGAFSLTSQAIQLGYLPRLRVRHTSVSHRGQIYVAPVNWLLMACTIGLVFGFQSSSKLAAAYGVAVTATMLITTTLFFVILRQHWRWSLAAAATLTSLFFAVDLSFFAANMTKIFHGAWFPLAVGLTFFTVMITWRRGSEILAVKSRKLTSSVNDFLARIGEERPERIKGQAFFLTRSRDIVPVALLQNLRHNRILHAEVFLLHIRTEEVPRVPNFEKIEVERLGSGICRIVARFGFMEQPDIDIIFSLCKGQGLDVDLDRASFFLGREKLTVGENPAMGRWRSNLFLFLSRNAMDAVGFFRIPSDKVIEVGARLEL
ncbi:potassium transporter Kup [Pseudodesulfovibrio cashew]|uniref:Probable potassium transport system protein Kup n=1 Tax=Pseudodesulfovibrio cashew TaxID=2678688 RepID=A0A6I6JFU6_9BACT|nr:potassium transporter Kup [Pseudodesulfovibrio cashew]QGY41705.1 potassium transporter Kup [Pseudodesulfovibrio cashew]